LRKLNVISIEEARGYKQYTTKKQIENDSINDDVSE